MKTLKLINCREFLFSLLCHLGLHCHGGKPEDLICEHCIQFKGRMLIWRFRPKLSLFLWMRGLLYSDLLSKDEEDDE